jgi:UDP-2,3-diacylglucosamine pyrophosphatase LpxH
LLVFSDVHLGSDLNEHPLASIRRSPTIDRDLVALLAHYRKTPPKGNRWRIVVAGDFIDFIGMAIRPRADELSLAPSEEEQEHGLGNAADHARVKVKRVAARHADVFHALASFVADGHALTFVHGNHDVELYWDEVKAEIKAQLWSAAKRTDVDAAAFAERIGFNEWFFYDENLAYIEHGHQYDEFCATETFMAPLSPRDPRRIRRGFCDVLLRFVVRQTRGLREHGHDKMGLVDYVHIGTTLGLRGGIRLLVRFIYAVRELFRVRSEYFLEPARALREEHERRMGLLAEATRIGVDRLRALAALQVPPVTASISGILASVLLDRLAVALACSIALVVTALVAGVRHGNFWYAGACIAVAWLLAHRYLSRRRKVDPDELLVERAAHLSRLFPAAFVVMGHTHVPLRVPVSQATTYINVGSWAEEEEAGERASMRVLAARTHLVIDHGESGPTAQFLRWSPDEGPRSFVGPDAKLPTPDPKLPG